MRRWSQAALVLCLVAVAPAVAHAGIVVEGSVGKGAKVSPSPVEAEKTNIMIAPGLSFLSLIRLQLGIVTDLPDAQDKKTDLEFRPMLTLYPPILPLYGRVIFAVTNLLHGKTEVAYGGAAGFKLGLGPVHVFAEAGLLPRSRASQINWVVEGRLGAGLSF